MKSDEISDRKERPCHVILDHFERVELISGIVYLLAINTLYSKLRDTDAMSNILGSTREVRA